MKKFLFVLCAIIIGLSAHAQNFNKEINLNTGFSKTVAINPFNAKEAITGIAVSGNITFYSDTSFVRIIVNDGNDNVYMLYETYPMLTIEKRFDFEYECEETSFLNDYFPVELQILVRDAKVSISKISLSNEKNAKAKELNQAKRLESNRSKLAAVQEYIKRKGLIWTADETDFSKMSYSSKAKYWGNGYASFGFEYYAGGIYSIFTPSDFTRVGTPSICHNFVDNFDWRNRHGANNPTSPYYDGDINGSGWVTPVVCQGGGCWYNNHYYCNTSQNTCASWGGIWQEAATCWIFGPVAQIEALVNLYYNQHLDVKLSEQYVACRSNNINAGSPATALNYFKNEGVPDDNCLTYSASLDNCVDLCTNPAERIWINSWSSYSHTTVTHDDIKRLLIQKGAIVNWR